MPIVCKKYSLLHIVLLYVVQKSGTIALMNPEPQRNDSTGEHQELRPGEAVSMRDNNAEPSGVVTMQPQEQHFYRSEPTSSGSTLVSQPSLHEYDTQTDTIDPRMQHVGRSVEWTGPEFIAHEKSSGWYAKYGGVAFLIVVVIALLSRDIFSTVVAVIVCGIFGYAAARQPRDMHYAVDDHGITIGRRMYGYGNFQAFSIVEEGQLLNLTFMPLKRFMPPMNLYFDPADQDNIMDVLTAHLPLESHRHDAVERLMRRIRF